MKLFSIQYAMEHIAFGIVWPDGQTTVRDFGEGPTAMNFDTLEHVRRAYDGEGITFAFTEV